MYSSEKNPGFNWKDIIIKAIFLIIFILLLIWLFPKVPNMKPFYSNVFRENIKYMQDAAESYYTLDKLPKNVGDTAEMTLQDMIDKKLILPFVDKDGNECDTKKSYVQVIKNEKDYTLRVNLVCPKEKDHVDKVLGCHDYCKDCGEVIEYQFRKPSTVYKSYYTCPDGGNVTNGTCNVYEPSTYKPTETVYKGEPYCPDGGKLNANKDKCVVSDSYSYTASKSVYTCPNGGDVSGTLCYLSYGKSASTYPAKIKDYECNGKTQSSSTCTVSSKSSYPATKTTSKVRYTVPQKGSEYSSLGTTTEYVCTSSKNCPGYVTYYNYIKTSYSCPNGGDVSGTTCIVDSPKTIQGTPNYYCPNGGTLSGTVCYLSGTPASTYKATLSDPCPKGGNLSGSKCIVDKGYSYKPSYKGGKTVYDCKTGGDGKLNSNNVCETTKLVKSYKAKLVTYPVTVYDYKWSTEKTLEGWEATGETRKKTTK